MQRLSMLVAFLVVGAVTTGILVGFTNGGPPGNSGAPGQGDCTSCHNTYGVNTGTAMFEIVAPSSVAPGSTIPVTVYFANTPASVFGFQMTVRDASGNFAGSWTVTDPTHTSMVGSQEITQTSAGASRSSWTAEWAAPAGLSSPVTFYAAGIEGDGSGAANDYAYTAAAVVPVFDPVDLTASSTNGDLSITVNGGTSRAGQEFYVLASANPAPGPVAGLVPDSLTFLVLSLPPVVPGVHAYLNGAGMSTAAYPAGFLNPLAGQTLRLVAVTLDPMSNPTGFSTVEILQP